MYKGYSILIDDYSRKFRIIDRQGNVTEVKTPADVYPGDYFKKLVDEKVSEIESLGENLSDW